MIYFKESLTAFLAIPNRTGESFYYLNFKVENTPTFATYVNFVFLCRVYNPIDNVGNFGVSVSSLLLEYSIGYEPEAEHLHFCTFKRIRTVTKSVFLY